MEVNFCVFRLSCRHPFINNELIVKTGLIDKRKVKSVSA